VPHYRVKLPPELTLASEGSFQKVVRLYLPGGFSMLHCTAGADRLTDEQICENILLLLLAGHDTSSTTLTLAMSNLQNHPEVVEKLRQEQQQVVAKHGEQLTAAALKDMVYADAVIRWDVLHVCCWLFLPKGQSPGNVLHNVALDWSSCAAVTNAPGVYCYSQCTLGKGGADLASAQPA
jgi:hypothetical protein